ncbi:MAG: hypothetical protein C0582_01145 [Alphaproteobacteria bacterium]|nr:MAG: hypothetical protein C0582_01145 [Alphaproteobacteria bacterium]
MNHLAFFFLYLSISLLTQDTHASDLSFVEICTQAGKPKIAKKCQFYSNSENMGAMYTTCRHLEKDPALFKKCLFKYGDALDMAAVYANGIDLKPDFWRAISYVCSCENQVSPAEFEAMIKVLYRATQTKNLEEKFHFCRYVTSSASAAACYAAKHQAIIQSLKDDLEAISKSFSPAQKKSYETFLQSAHDFIKSHLDHEIDLSGSGRSLTIMNEHEDLLKLLLKTIIELVNKQLKPAHKTSCNSAESQMNTTYQELIDVCKKRGKKIADLYGPTRKGIEKTQQKFFTFLTNFTLVASEHAPDVPPQKWQPLITLFRLNQLKKLLHLVTAHQ